jgi:hypothetical protein
MKIFHFKVNNVISDVMHSQLPVDDVEYTLLSAGVVSFTKNVHTFIASSTSSTPNEEERTFL